MKLLQKLLATCVLTLACAFPLNAEDQLGPEMLVNGFFSDGSTGWKLEALEGAKAELILTPNACDGKPSADISIQNIADPAKLWAVQLIQENLSFQGGKTYRITFYAKSSPAKWFFVTLGDSKPPFGPLTPGSQVPADDNWHQFSYDFKVEKDCDEGRLVFTNLNVDKVARSIAQVSLKQVLPAK